MEQSAAAIAAHMQETGDSVETRDKQLALLIVEAMLNMRAIVRPGNLLWLLPSGGWLRFPLPHARGDWSVANANIQTAMADPVMGVHRLLLERRPR